MPKPQPRYKVSKAPTYPANQYGGYAITEAGGAIVYDAECFDQAGAKLACKIMNELDCETWEDLEAEMERRGWADPLKVSANQ